jgi:hypothetical protein
MAKRLSTSQRKALLDALYQEGRRLLTHGASIQEMDRALRQFRADWLNAQQQGITLTSVPTAETGAAAHGRGNQQSH